MQTTLLWAITLGNSAVLGLIMFRLSATLTKMETANGADYVGPKLGKSVRDADLPLSTTNKTLVVMVDENCPACRVILSRYDDFSMPTNTDLLLLDTSASSIELHDAFKKEVGVETAPWFRLTQENHLHLTGVLEITATPSYLILNSQHEVLESGICDDSFQSKFVTKSSGAHSSS